MNWKVVQFLVYLAIASFLSYCSGGGGDEGGGEGNVASTLNVTVQGLAKNLTNSTGLVLELPDGSEKQLTDNGNFQYSNQGKAKQSNAIKIAKQPKDQACIVKADPDGDSSGSTLNIGVNCGAANVISVSGIKGTLSSPLIITRDLAYYENRNLSVSSFALMSIYKNSSKFKWDDDGYPSTDNYYSFLYSTAFDEVPFFEQDIRIIEQPDGYQCFSFEGKKGNHQIHCQQIGETNKPSYELAQQCVAIKLVNKANYLSTSGPDSYAFNANDIASAEKYFLKPSRLGAFMLYDRDGKFLSRNESAEIIKDDTHNQEIEWIIRPGEQVDYINGDATVLNGQFLIPYSSDGFRLQHDLSFALEETPEEHNDSSYQSTGQLFELVTLDNSECTAYPEAALDAVIDPSFYTPKDPEEPVYGFADIHTHYAFPRAIGGMAMSGDVFHRYGIAHALGDCDGLHGSDGSDDLLGSQGGGGSHNVTGYPEFTEWPNHETVTHVTTYYRWIQRAYLSGLRLSVTLATGNPTFCEVLEQVHPGKKKAGCKGRAAVAAQSDYIYQIQDYVDAQEGGPGKGWFRVVTSAAQARQVISENKLAVVLGAEHGELFNCREKSSCTFNQIDDRIQEAYDQGVRMFFPVHRFDNKFAGSRPGGGSRNAWMNLTNKISTSRADDLIDIGVIAAGFGDIGGHYWQLEECPGLPDHNHDVNGVSGLYSMQEFKNNELSIITDPLQPYGLDGAVEAQLGPFPSYVDFQDEESNACNIRGLHPEGEYLLQALMDKGLMIDIDHLSYYAAESAMDLIAANNYSGVSSSHGWTENSVRFRNRVLQQGGVMGIFNTTPTSFANQIDWMRDNLSTGGYMSSFALGSDIQGVTSQPGPDGAAGTDYISYPFSSLDGKVQFYPPQTGNRAFDYETEGIAHYGLYAEWIEHLRQIDQDGGDDVLAQFMNSAEAFLQMWERAEASAVN